MKLYWVETFDRSEDWFVIAKDKAEAEFFVEDSEGYDSGDCKASEICPISQSENSFVTGYAGFDLLKDLGFEIVREGTPALVWKNGKLYKEGDIVLYTVLNIYSEMPGVYVINQSYTDLFKIGNTKDLSQRFGNLQTSNPDDLVICVFTPTNKAKELESKLHDRFRLKKFKREWFKLDYNDLKEIMEISKEYYDNSLVDERLNKFRQNRDPTHNSEHAGY